MKIDGGCHCGAIRYQAEGEVIIHALCHCSDCRRHFCADCGTGLFYKNAQILTERIERIKWMAHVHELPTFERYPPKHV